MWLAVAVVQFSLMTMENVESKGFRAKYWLYMSHRMWGGNGVWEVVIFIAQRRTRAGGHLFHPLIHAIVESLHVYSLEDEMPFL